MTAKFLECVSQFVFHLTCLLRNPASPASNQVQSVILPHSGCPSSLYLSEALQGSPSITAAWLGAALQHVQRHHNSSSKFGECCQ